MTSSIRWNSSGIKTFPGVAWLYYRTIPRFTLLDSLNRIVKPNILRVLIVEDTPERQEILRRLYKDHAWILVHTAARAMVLLNAYDFDLVSLDYNLAGPKDGDTIASFMAASRNAKTKVIIHSMNPKGADQIAKYLPQADLVPISKMIRNNQTFKRLRRELLNGVDINWARVFGKEKATGQQ